MRKACGEGPNLVVSSDIYKAAEGRGSAYYSFELLGESSISCVPDNGSKLLHGLKKNGFASESDLICRDETAAIEELLQEAYTEKIEIDISLQPEMMN